MEGTRSVGGMGYEKIKGIEVESGVDLDTVKCIAPSLRDPGHYLK